MPTLLLFAPCEKVIIAHDNNTVSLISIFQDLTITVPVGVQVPETVLVPMRWSGFTMWKKQAEDEGKRYEQELSLCGPDGTALIGGTFPIEMSAPAHRVNAEFTFFPMKETGAYTLNLYLREDKPGEEKKLIATFPLAVTKKVEG